MLTHAQAIAEGYTVDAHAPGRPIAYRGPRFAPTAVVGVFTEHEGELRAVLEAYERLWAERATLLGVLSPELQSLREWASQALTNPRTGSPSGPAPRAT